MMYFISLEIFHCLGDFIAYNMQKMMDTLAWNKEITDGKSRMDTGTERLSAVEEVCWK